MSRETTRAGAGQISAFARDASQFLTFVLGAEEYGIDILRVQELRGYSPITSLPNTPPHIKGVMNLRGAVVPIVDLRAKFGMPQTEYNKFTVIILVMVGARVCGLIVDAVSDVLNVDRSEIEPPPLLEGGVDTSFMTGMAKAGDRLILLLDIDRVIGTAEVVGLARTEASATTRPQEREHA
jgi:purine-binding chemotaxis protein CheW